MGTYQELKDQLLAKEQLFSDEDFPAGPASVYYKKVAGRDWDNIVWKRPTVSSTIKLLASTFILVPCNRDIQNIFVGQVPALIVDLDNSNVEIII